MTPKEIAKYLIENNYLMSVATSDTNGKPWISVVGFAYDEKYNLYWVSHKDHLHSRNIRARPQVGIVIFGSLPTKDMDGIFFDAEATELENEEDILIGMKARAKRESSEKFTIHAIDDVRGNASWRLYRAVPKEITKRANGIDPATGQAITIREKVKLD